MANPVQVLGILRDARGLIADEKDWCGDGIGSGRTHCAIAALVHVITRSDDPGPGDHLCGHPAYKALAAVVKGPVGFFNDSHTHAEVLTAFDKAIRTLEADIAYNAFMAEPEPTPQADATIEVILAVEECAGVLARQVVAEHPQMDYGEVHSMVAAELFYAAQDAAWALDMGVKIEREAAA